LTRKYNDAGACLQNAVSVVQFVHCNI